MYRNLITRIPLLVITTILAVSFQTSQSQPPGWEIEIVEAPRLFDELTGRSLALDAADNPHIAYGEDHLYHAWHDGSEWNFETVDNDGGTGRDAAIVLESGMYPHVSYYKSGAVKYAYNDGSGWRIQTIDTGNYLGHYTCIALDSDNYPHISYYQYGSADNKVLKYAYEDVAGWHIDSVYMGDGCTHTSITVDTNDYPHISFSMSTSLGYAYKDNDGWHQQFIDPQPQGASGTSILLDGDDYPHISYGKNAVKYAYMDIAGWHIETIEYASLEDYTSLVFDDEGYPHVGYVSSSHIKYAFKDPSGWNLQDLGTGAEGAASLELTSQGYACLSHLNWNENILYYRYQDVSGWHQHTVDTQGDGGVGAYSSLAIDIHGTPHISYYAVPQPDFGLLKYAYRSPSGWVLETIDSAGDVGSHSSLAVDDNGYPRISYYDQLNPVDQGYLKYAFENASGWHIQWIDYQDHVGKYTSLEVDKNGYSHISYFADTPWYRLKYAYQDATGWHIETVDDGGSVGEFTSLALDEKNYPHISYYSYSLTALKYACKDETGWTIETVDNEGSVGTFTSIDLDGSNHPHISYRDLTNGTLKYAHYNGSVWHIETMEDPWVSMLFTSIAVDDAGFPHIGSLAYTDTSSQLRYRYKDEAGWHVALIDDQGAPYYISLALNDAGFPRMSYQDASGADLKYTAYRPITLVLDYELTEDHLLLTWSPVDQASNYWVYGASNDPFFIPGLAPVYEYRQAVLPIGTTTWHNTDDIGNPAADWTYLVIAVDASESVLATSNCIGENEFNWSGITR